MKSYLLFPLVECEHEDGRQVQSGRMQGDGEEGEGQGSSCERCL